MRVFDYAQLPQSLLTYETMNLVAKVHECRGRQGTHLAAKPDFLASLTGVAMQQCAEASCAIEGICTTDERLPLILSEGAKPRSWDEKYLAGYRDALRVVLAEYSTAKVTPELLQRLHRILFHHGFTLSAGRFRNMQDLFPDPGPEGRRIRYADAKAAPLVSVWSSEAPKPVSYIGTESALEEAVPDPVIHLCAALRVGLTDDKCDPLLTTLLFTLDFLCMHPFADGNGRMSRLLVLLLLCQSGFFVGKYVSVAAEMNRTADEYRAVLAASSEGWAEECNDPAPFVNYMLGVILSAYVELESRVVGVSTGKMSKAQRVAACIGQAEGKVCKADILAACPDVSMTTVERVLADLLAEGRIRKVGGGRSTGYLWGG